MHALTCTSGFVGVILTIVVAIATAVGVDTLPAATLPFGGATPRGGYKQRTHNLLGQRTANLETPDLLTKSYVFGWILTEKKVDCHQSSAGPKFCVCRSREKEARRKDTSCRESYLKVRFPFLTERSTEQFERFL